MAYELQFKIVLVPHFLLFLLFYLILCIYFYLFTHDLSSLFLGGGGGWGWGMGAGWAVILCKFTQISNSLSYEQ